MKKILILSQNYYPEIGSAANRMKNIHGLLVKKGFNVTVLTTEPSYPNQILYKSNGNTLWKNEDLEKDVLRVRTNMSRYTKNMIRRLFFYFNISVKFIRILMKLEKNFDYIFVTTPAIFVGFAGVFAKKIMKKPLILDIRDLWPESLIGVGVFSQKPFLKMAYFLEDYLYSKADEIVINSEGFKPYLRKKGISQEKISFIPNSLTEKELSFIDTIEYKSRKVSVVYTGNIGLAQNIEKFVSIAERLKTNSNIQFKIIGYGNKKNKVINMIKTKKLSNIEMLNPKNRNETLLELVKSDIAYVSLTENKVFETVLPGKVIDYMCVGKPIIGDVSGHCRDVIVSAACGYVPEKRNVDELTKYIQYLANNQSLRQELGQNGYKYACNRLRWTKNIHVLTKILEDFDEH